MAEKIKIGLVLYNLDSSYQSLIYHGIKDQAEKEGIQLFCIAGEPLDTVSVPSMQFYSAKNLLPVDGLLVLSSIYIDSSSFSESLCLEQLLESIPVISLGARLGNFYSLTVDIKKPYKELITHLIDTHHYRRFLYIGGSQSNPDNKIREGIVKEVISEENKSGFELTILNAEYFNEYEAAKLMRGYQKEHKSRDIDVVIAASDDMAIGIRRYLEASSHSSWYNCPVIGFDNIPRLKKEFPGLTTIHQPIREMGQESVRILKKIITGKKSDQHNTIAAEKRIRTSCGCTEYNPEIHDGDDFDRWEKHHLRESSYFGQNLMNIRNLHEIIPSLMGFLQNLGILDFIFITYPEYCTQVPDDGYLIYEKNRRTDKDYSRSPRLINLKEYFDEIISSGNLHSTTHNIFHLYSGKEQLGIIMYSTGEDIHSFMSHCIVFLSQALKRLQVLAREMKYTEDLEKEVKIRTEELKNEAKKRVKVEAEVLRISELERQRFSMDLHDDICQRLASIYMISDHFSQKNQEYKHISELIKETLQLTRQYAHNSFPVELEQIGLKKALERLCRSWDSRNPWNCSLDFRDEVSFSRQIEVNIYRIVQEALYNSHKHSGADTVRVSLIPRKDFLELTISDNGEGDSSLGQIKKEEIHNRRPSGLGLRSMEYRAHQLKGEFNIKSSRKRGTEIIITIPIEGSTK